MLNAAWLALGAMLCTLQLSTGSFPKPLSPQEEAHYLALSQQGDLEARNILIQRNLRLVAHIMKKILRQRLGPGGPDLHRHHRPHQGDLHL